MGKMKRIFYEKIGKRYKPIKEHDSALFDGFPKGSHLVVCVPGSKITRFNIDPAIAPMLAAGEMIEAAMAKAIYKATEMRSTRTPLTQGQSDAWKKLSEEFGDGLCSLQYNSASDVAKAGIEELAKEAKKMLAVPAVKKAYEHFMFLYKLTKEENESKS